ncbi:sensor histidine kinase [Lentzea sp. CC55]|uniref:sensor histidine kinase n=1 Tax=Lentzea sp. CC55 TaxID=2884909 RepID=UPI0027DEDDAE|nr:sensor histidine kinase [Lentzea sp. CC55]
MSPRNTAAGPGRSRKPSSGLGLGTEDLGRIFDRFYRADTSRSLPGSGLGLAIVAGIAEAHGGTTFARNRTGGGATISFTIAAGRLLHDR